MHTLTDSRPRVQNTCRLVLTIGDIDHAVKPVPMATTASMRAFAMRSGDYGRFVVSQDAHGCRCTHSGCEGETACVHARALVATGLLRPAVTAPVVFPRRIAPAAARTFGEGLEEPEASRPTAAAPAKVNAFDWARQITGKFWEVATEGQKDLAVAILNDDTGRYYGRAIAPAGPSIEELAAGITNTISEGVKS